MSLTREAGFGAEVKRRIMIGTYALSSGYYDAYYGQAQKVRTLIARDFAAAFEQADVLVSPTSPFVAFGIGERDGRPDGDVRQRPVHAARIARGHAGDLGAVRAVRGPAGRAADHGAGARRRPLLPGGRGIRSCRRAGAASTPGGWRHDAQLRRRARAVRAGDRSRDPRRARHRLEDVLRLLDGVRRRTQYAYLPGVPRPAGRAARGQRDGDRVDDPDRSRAELLDRRVVPVRPQELLLPGHAEELPDLAVRRAAVRRGLPRRRG